jgi:hypothetical protein
MSQTSKKQKDMPQRFIGPATEIKPFADWVHKVATSSAAKWRNLRRKLREESTPEPGERRKASESFLKEMHRQFPSMTGCRTDISCLKQLFEAFVNMLDLNESRLKKKTSTSPEQLYNDSFIESLDLLNWVWDTAQVAWPSRLRQSRRSPGCSQSRTGRPSSLFRSGIDPDGPTAVPCGKCVCLTIQSTPRRRLTGDLPFVPH